MPRRRRAATEAEGGRATRPPSARSRHARVLLVATFLLALAAALWQLPQTRHGAPDAAWRLSWWEVGLLAALAELAVQHVHVRREAHAVSLSELAVVTGLFFALPADFVGGRVVGSVLVFVLWRRQGLVKVVFNAALYLAESCLAELTFHTALGSAGLGPRAWAATFAATAVCAVLAAAAVSSVIALVEGGVKGRDVVVETGRGVVTACSTTTVALVGVHALDQSRLAAVPLVICLAILLTGYRRYAWLWERHLGLERLHQFNQALQSSPVVDDVLLSTVRQATEVTRAEQAEVVFLAADVRRPPVRVDSPDGSTLRRTLLGPAEAADPLWAEVAAGSAVLLGRGRYEPGTHPYLEQRGLPDAVVVPLHAEAGVVGAVIAAGHASQVRSFDEHDLRVLEAVAAQTSLALQRGELADRLRHDAVHDALTGLQNRAGLHQDLDRALARVRDGSLPGVRVAILDLIDFRQVNHVLGSAIADLVLQAVGERLAEAVPPGARLARLGSDEFAVLLDARRADPEEAAADGRALLDALERPLSVAGLDIEVGASVGLADAPTHGDTVQTLMQRAEAALEAAKRAGGGVQVFEAHLEPDASPARLALLGELRQGIHNGQLEVYLQPQADLVTGEVVGAEALVRWRHPELGLVPPDDFIPLAERTGLIRPLTSAVLGEAVAHCGAWRRLGLDLAISVNLSPRSVLDPGLVEAIETLLAVHQVPAGRLTLEITESSVLDEPERTGAVLERLHDLGVRLSVDDFGTGYSSLSHLRRLPLHEIKIDKSFVLAMGRNAQDEAIVRSVIDLGTLLRLDIVAEGIEDQATWDRLEALGCTLAQGYHLARPMPAEQFVPWLRARDAERAGAAADARRRA